MAEQPEVIQKAEELTGIFGARHQELAQYFEVDVTTIDYWVKSKPEFAAAVYRGRARAGLTVSQALYKKATGCTITEQVVIQNEVKTYHENGRIKSRHIEPIIINVTKEIPPDAYAAHKWLSIIHREIWADVNKMDINHHHSGEITHRKIEELSLDELSEPVKNMLFELNMKQLSDGQSN